MGEPRRRGPIAGSALPLASLWLALALCSSRGLAAADEPLSGSSRADADGIGGGITRPRRVLLAGGTEGDAIHPGGTGAANLTRLFVDRLAAFDRVLPNRSSSLLPSTLRFLYADLPVVVMQHGISVPELGDMYEGDGAKLYGNISAVVESRGGIGFMQGLTMLLAAVSNFDPLRYASLRTAYPVARRAVMAFILDHYLTHGKFDEQEALLVQALAARLYKLHRQAAQSKRILEFFHVSKSGGTSICQLGQLNGCMTESFGLKQNCMITYFRDVPRWTVGGAIANLSRTAGDPWCAKHGRPGSRLWTCPTRRQLMTKFR